MSPLSKRFGDAEEIQTDRDTASCCAAVFDASVTTECLGNGV